MTKERPCVPTPNPLAPSDLPAWAPALPLWLATPWLWVTPANDGSLAYRRSGRPDPSVGRVATWADLLPAPPYTLIVLDCRAAAAPVASWAALAVSLAPGGVLFVCGVRRRGLRAAISAAAPTLQPATWHQIVARQDGTWHLYPAGPAARRLLSRQLDPPDSFRAWLRELWHRLPIPHRHITCLPVWQPEAKINSHDTAHKRAAEL